MDVGNLFSVKGKIALVTGGASGIGLMMTEALVKSGAKVYIASRKKKHLEAVAEQLSEFGECIPIQANLDSEEGCIKLVDAIQTREDKLDILVNNSGKVWGEGYETFPWQAWDTVLTVNLTAPFELMKRFTPMLAKAGTADDPARIVNMGSVVGRRPHGNMSYSYAASKSGIHHMTTILAQELADQNITVNAIAPGPFPSRMMAFVTDDDAAVKELCKSVPLGRIGSPEDAAGTLLYLCSRAGAFVTGAIVPLDGGMGVGRQGKLR
jgi:NAD(P)-dependent dehydrogenase (short-subunit alcohol dehydrogenase family)